MTRREAIQRGAYAVWQAAVVAGLVFNVHTIREIYEANF